MDASMQISLILKQRVLEDRINQAEDFTFATLGMVKETFSYEAREPVRPSQKNNSNYVMSVNTETELGRKKLKAKVKELAVFWPRTYVTVHYVKAPWHNYHFYIGTEAKQ